MELTDLAKMCIFKDAEHHIISCGCGDMKGLNIRSEATFMLRDVDSSGNLN